MGESRWNLPSRRRFLQFGGVGMAALSGCFAWFGGFNDDGNDGYDIRRSDIFVSGENGYTLYRIPSRLVTEEGTLLAFCEGRRGEGNDRSPTDLLLKRSADGGQTWTDRQVVYSEGDKTISNPTPVVDQSSGTIHPPLCREYRDLLMTRSTDDGETWELGGTVGEYVDELQAVELPDGRIMMNMRSTPDATGMASPDGTYRAAKTSSDGGETWSELSYDETLVTPNCQSSFIRYSWPSDGRSRILFANPAHGDSRVDLTIRLSYDEGESWAY